MMVSGALFWAIGQVLARKLGRDEGVLLLKGLAIAGLPQLILATLLLEQGQLAAVQTADPLDWAALGFVAVVGFLVAYAVWFTLLRLYPVDAVAPFVLLMPAAGILTASVVLHETILAAQLIGGAVIIVGLAIVTLPHKNALRSEEPA
jgi:O-acetylserine/cysteine efflux transporter